MNAGVEDETSIWCVRQAIYRRTISRLQKRTYRGQGKYYESTRRREKVGLVTPGIRSIDAVKETLFPSFPYRGFF